MKANKLLLSLFILLSGLTFGQEGFVWEENYNAEVFQQSADGNTVLVDITNEGEDAAQCIQKARAQAIYQVIFMGLPATASAPASSALSMSGKQLYNEKLDFFKTYLPNNTGGQSFITKAATNMNKPASKLSKKLIRHTTTVTLSKKSLREDLERQGILQGMESLGFKPTVLIVPGDVWMGDLGMIKRIDNQGYEQTNYNYTDAVNVKEFNSAAEYVKSGFGDAFEIADFKQKLDEINLEVQKNNSRTENVLAESDMDIYARVVSAELWVKIELEKGPGSTNQQTAYKITLKAQDPLTGIEVLSGEPTTIQTVGSDYMSLLKNAMKAAADEFRPRIMKYFTDREANGLNGKLIFTVKDGSGISFDEDIEVDGEEYAFSQVIDAMVGKEAAKKKPAGAQTSTRRVYDVTIPTKTKNALTEEIEDNNFESFARKVNKSIKKFGYKAIVEPQGLGKVIVVFTEKI